MSSDQKMKQVTRVYLDTNIYCRPLDCQEDKRIHAETEAILKIIDSTENGETAIISSDYVKFEIERIQEDSKRKDVRGFERILSKVNVSSSKRLSILARKFVTQCNLGSLDALHMAAACVGKADFLLTCDDEIIDASMRIEKFAAQEGYKLKVRNPINYVKKMGNEK
jgi:predicted nucleic acid-binding protein